MAHYYNCISKSLLNSPYFITFNNKLSDIKWKEQPFYEPRVFFVNRKLKSFLSHTYINYNMLNNDYIIVFKQNYMKEVDVCRFKKLTFLKGLEFSCYYDVVYIPLKNIEETDQFLEILKTFGEWEYIDREILVKLFRGC